MLSKESLSSDRFSGFALSRASIDCEIFESCRDLAFVPSSSVWLRVARSRQPVVMTTAKNTRASSLLMKIDIAASRNHSSRDRIGRAAVAGRGSFEDSQAGRLHDLVADGVFPGFPAGVGGDGGFSEARGAASSLDRAGAGKCPEHDGQVHGVERAVSIGDLAEFVLFRDRDLEFEV